MTAAIARTVPEVLDKNNGQVNRLYSQTTAAQAARVKSYVQDSPAIKVFPTILGTVCQYTAGGGLIGLGAGAAAGGMGAPIGAGVGLAVGFTTGCVVAYYEQKSQYHDWLKDERNIKVNNEVLQIIRQIVRERTEAGVDGYNRFLDPISGNFMERPVIDPISGQVFDFASGEQWINKHGTNPINSHQQLRVADLRVDYETHGRLRLFYKQILADQVEGVKLTANQRICVQMLYNDLDKLARHYYDKARQAIDADFQSGRITMGQHGERIFAISRMLDPVSLVSTKSNISMNSSATASSVAARAPAPAPAPAPTPAATSASVRAPAPKTGSGITITVKK